jgi:hypothetical protein
VARIFYVHWHEAEARGRAAALRAAGHEVHVHWSTQVGPRLGDGLPDVVVVSIDRLPSHGRAIAEWVWEAKRRRHIPIVFCGGTSDKVSATLRRFPQAVFCAPDRVVQTLATLARHRAPLAGEPAGRPAPGRARSPVPQARSCRGPHRR